MNPFSRAALISLVLASPLCAANPEPDSAKWFTVSESRTWLAHYDPTLIGRRADTEFSFERDQCDKTTTEIDPTVRDAWGIAKNFAVGFQAELPIKWETKHGDLTSGLADLEIRAGFVQRLTSNFRWGGALNLEFPTASDPALRDAFELRPILAVSWDATRWLNFGINAAYSITPDPGYGSTVNKFELKFPVAVSFSTDWSAAVTYKPTWYYQPDSMTHRLELDVTRLFGSRHQFAISPGVEVPLSRQNLEYKLILDVAWYF